MLTGAGLRLGWNAEGGRWELVIEVTLFVTYAAVNVWTGRKANGNDPIGQSTRQSSGDPAALLAVAAG